MLRRINIVGWSGSLAAAFCGVAVSVNAAAPDLPLPSPPTATNVLQLRQLAIPDQSVTVSLQLVGTVWWSSAADGTLILADDSDAQQLELDLPGPMPRQGDRLILSGAGVVVKTTDAIKIAAVPVVDNDGQHMMKVKSGSANLPAGLQPIRVAWFNRTAKYGLGVSYEGPGVPRQDIPNTELFRAEVDPASGNTNFVQGLDYLCCEGAWWSCLPNFDHLPAVKSGVTDNFNLAVRSRDEHVGLQFSGYIKVPQDGHYTFWTRSDDGSRLFIGEPSLHLEIGGHTALPSRQTVGRVESPSAEDEYQWGEIEGTVTFVSRLAGSLEIELGTESGRVRMKMAEDPACSFTLAPQNRIRAVGVCRTVHSLDGRRAPGEFFVQSWNDIEQPYITPDIWSEYPRAEISITAGTNSVRGLPPVVHLRGKIISAGPGQPLMLEDGSGRTALETTETNFSVGQMVEVLGRLNLAGTHRVLQWGYFRRDGENPRDSGTLPVLTTVEQVHQLGHEEAGRCYPVKLRGVITSPLDADAAAFQDATRGIYLSIGKPIPLHVGDYCEVEGTTEPYDFSPYVQVTSIRCLGPGTLPNPVRPTWDQLLNGTLHLQYTELEGVATLITNNSISLLTRGGRINIRLNPFGPQLPAGSDGAIVMLRGIYFADWNWQSRQIELRDNYFDQKQIEIVQPAPEDPFAIPVKHVGELLRFDPQAGALQRVKVFGQVIHAGKAGCFLMDGASGLKFIPLETPDLQPGDLVDVVGFPELSGPSPIIQDALVRRHGTGDSPVAHKLEAGGLIHDEYDSTLVQVDGVLVSLSTTSGAALLEMQNGLLRYTAVLEGKYTPGESLPVGSRLSLTGTYVGLGGNRVLGLPINSFQLLLDSPSAIRILARPPWWNLNRLLGIMGLLVGVLLVTLLWIKSLHRKVAERTLQLETQIQRRQRAERQHEVEQERTRVANNLHDDLGAGLTEVNMLTALVKSPTTSAEEKIRYLDQLSEMALRMVTSLDEIVWAVNPRNDTIASLAGYFGAYAQRFLELAAVTCALDVADDLPDYNVDSKFRHEIFLAFKEALNNVIRHAVATTVWLKISIQDNTLIVVVTDNGRGIKPGKPEAGADGLVNMQERLARLGGRCNIQSEPEKGTSVYFQAPLPETLP